MNPEQPSPPRQPTLLPGRRQVLAILREHYPCKRTPWGTWRRIAREVGVSYQRVAQIAKQAGWSMDRPTSARPMYQCVCGKVQASSDLCYDCRYVELPCEQCEKPVRISAALLASRVARHPGSLSYTGRVFCGRECFGRWSGRTYNGARRRQRLARLHALLQDRHPSSRAPHGAWRVLAAQLGVHAIGPDASPMVIAHLPGKHLFRDAWPCEPSLRPDRSADRGRIAQAFRRGFR